MNIAILSPDPLCYSARITESSCKAELWAHVFAWGGSHKSSFCKVATGLLDLGPGITHAGRLIQQRAPAFTTVSHCHF